jgi:hypothetical protein
VGKQTWHRITRRHVRGSRGLHIPATQRDQGRSTPRVVSGRIASEVQSIQTAQERGKRFHHIILARRQCWHFPTDLDGLSHAKRPSSAWPPPIGLAAALLSPALTKPNKSEAGPRGRSIREHHFDAIRATVASMCCKDEAHFGQCKSPPDQDSNSIVPIATPILQATK